MASFGAKRPFHQDFCGGTLEKKKGREKKGGKNLTTNSITEQQSRERKRVS